VRPTGQQNVRYAGHCYVLFLLRNTKGTSQVNLRQFYKAFLRAVTSNNCEMWSAHDIRLHIVSDNNIISFCPVTLVYYDKFKHWLPPIEYDLAGEKLGLSVGITRYIVFASDGSSRPPFDKIAAALRKRILFAEKRKGKSNERSKSQI
jgi:hypothetical protein